MAKIYLSGVGSVGWLYSDYNASLTSNWTELEWTGTELGKKVEDHGLNRQKFDFSGIQTSISLKFKLLS